MRVVTYSKTDLHLLESNTHDFLIPQKEVALGYGVVEGTIRSHLFKRSDELIENKHWVRLKVQTNGGKQNVIHWTKKGIVRLGFFIKSKEAKKFRDWAEDYIVKPNNALPAAEERITYFVENRFNAIAEELRSIKDQVLEDTKERQEVRLLLQQSSIATSNLTRALENLPLETTQLAFIRQSVEDKGRELAEARGLHSEIVIPAIFREIKRFYDVPSYTYLSRDDYHSVLHTIRTFTI